MADELKFSEGIVKEDRGYLYPGGFKIDKSGIVFKSRKTGHVEQLKKDDIFEVQWQRLGTEEGLTVVTQDGDMYRFGGFSENDHDRIKNYIKTHFDVEMSKKDRALEGWNWGQTKFRGNTLMFRGGKEKKTPIFDVPLKNVRECTLESKNEVALKFHRNEDMTVPLMELRFHIPAAGLQEGQEDPVQKFIDSVLAKANVIQATGDAVASFGELRCITPRGSYDVKMFPTFIQLHGKTHNHMIPLTSVLRLFRLPHRDQRQIHFVMSLDPPINQGQTLYPFVIFNFNSEDEMKLELNFQEVKEKFEGKIEEQLEGPAVDLICKVTKLLVLRKVTHPAEGYCGRGQVAVIPCSYRNNQGLLYPLDRGFIWVHKPPVHVRFDEIACINFSRSGGSTRSFDIEIELKREGGFTFSSIEKDEYARLFDFCTNKKLRIKNIGGAAASKTVSSAVDDDMIDSDADDDGHDAYLQRVKAEGRERDEDDEESDEDFNPDKASGSEGSVAEEFDSDASSSEEDGDGSDDSSKKSKKKKLKEKKKEKKRSKDGESSKKKKKKRGDAKEAKDPDKPKKPMTAYFLWFNENREKLKEKYSDLAVTELAKKGGELWREIKDKSKWENESKRLKEEYDKNMSTYNSSGAAASFAEKAKSSKSSSSEKKKKKSSSSDAKSASKKKTSSPSKSSFKSAEFIESSSDSSDSDAAGDAKKKPSKDKKKKDAKSDDDSDAKSEEEKKKKSKKGKKDQSDADEDEEEEEETPASDEDSD